MPSEGYGESRSRVGTPKDSSTDLGAKRVPSVSTGAELGSSSGSLSGSKTPKPAAKNVVKKPAKKVLRLENVLPEMASFEVFSA